ncbi:hypothetical protein CF95_gp108 [Erwinia phage PhiEaH1]|uniref:Uncharacterized protein n=1 Tax=Erwinia phage PhiEaH1 TaxID=1401669 RepID=W8CZX7_9CAUD|nr:hypothetical protein CF95_gp108 [Erwinia phage PhiEaH1]AGX01830.1 hypothetical protein [Erwinia phage PhiEaH1]
MAILKVTLLQVLERPHGEESPRIVPDVNGQQRQSD